MDSSAAHPTGSRRAILGPLLSAIALERRDIFSVAVYALFSGLLTLVVPVSVQALVNTISFGTLLQPLITLAALVLLLLGISALCRVMLLIVVESIQRRLFVRLGFAWTLKLAQPSASGLEPKKFLEISTIQKAAAVFLVDGMAIVLQLVVGLLLLAVYHPWFLAFDLLLIGALLVSILGFSGKGTRTSLQESSAKYEFVAFLESQAREGTNKHAALKEADEKISRYLRERRNHFSVLMFHHLSGFGLQVFFSALLLGLGGWLVIQKQLSLGQLVAAELVLTSVLSGASKLGKYLETYYDLLASFSKAVPRVH